jgi:putative membrane protein
MSTIFAFLHHLAAFTLVAALAIEFVLIGQIQINDAAVGLPIPIAKRLVIADAVLGASAGGCSSSFSLPRWGVGGRGSRGG